MIDRETLNRLNLPARELFGNEPIVLDGPPVLRFVESGSVALFCAEAEGDTPTGPRRLIQRIGSGQAVFAIPEEFPPGLRFLVVPIKQAVIREVPLEACFGPDADPALRSAAGALVDGWVEIVARNVTAEYPEPKLTAKIAEGELALDAGQALSADRRGTRWVRVQSGACHFLGLEGISPIGPGGLFPVGAGLWAGVREETRVSARTSRTSSPGELVEGLVLLHRLALALLKLQGEEDEADELERLRERERIQTEHASDALRELASVLEPSVSPLSGDDPLFLAFAAVGRSMGVSVVPPGKSEQAKQNTDPLEAIARASRVRTRRVALTGTWWKRDCGSLIGFTAEEEPRPVALLKTRRVRYEVFDPLDHSRTPVGARVAGELLPEAVMVYRPLPEGPLKLLDLARFSVAGRYKDLGLVIVGGVAATLLGMIVPQATALLMDQAIPDANVSLLWQIGAGLLAAAIGQVVFSLSQGIILLRVGMGSEAESQAALWDRLLRLRPSFFRRFSSGDLQSRVMAVNEIGRQLSGATLSTLFSSLLALLNLGLLYYYSPKLSFIAVGVGLVVMVFTITMSGFIRKKYIEMMELEGKFFGLVVQLINAVGKLRVAGAERRAFTHWMKGYTAQLRLWNDASQLSEVVYVFNAVLPTLGAVLLFSFAHGMLQDARLGLGEGLSLGTFLAFHVAFGTFLGGITSLSSTVVGFLDIFAKSKRVKPILEEEPEIDLHKADPGVLTGEIELENVEFSYREDGPRILDGVSLKAEPGEFVALVGPSGCGKSTLLRLILGFETPAEGTVSYDGQDLSSLDVLAVRRQLGVVLQGGRLDAGSIFDNIACGSLITLDDAWAAAEDAGFAPEVREMPMGMHTMISVGGGNLSGGQRQRLLIARALAQRPRILLFDEATSALDNRTQAIVSESLERLNVTRLVIAHRLSTIQNADRIYVLEGGEVVQSGRFEELMAEEEGLFARMMARQVA